jgi:hypothetical protein
MKVEAGMRYRSVGLGFCGGSRRGVFEVLSVAAFGNNCQRQSKSEPKGSTKCCHFGVSAIAA